MQRHPVYTWEILNRVGAFAGFARTAALHHEKLDGSGHPWGVKGEELDRAARILCVADMYEALTASRPYRAGLSRDAALQIIAAGSGKHVCAEATAALGRSHHQPPSGHILTARACRSSCRCSSPSRRTQRRIWENPRFARHGSKRPGRALRASSESTAESNQPPRGPPPDREFSCTTRGRTC